MRRPSFLDAREARDRITDVSGCAGVPGMSVSAVRVHMNDAPERLLMSSVSHQEFTFRYMIINRSNLNRLNGALSSNDLILL